MTLTATVHRIRLQLRNIVRKIWWVQYPLKYRKSIFHNLLLSLAVGAIATLDPLFMRRIIDVALPGMHISMAMIAALGLALCFVFRAWLNGVSNLSNFKVAQLVSQDLRCDLLVQMTSLSADWHERTLHGEKLSRFDQDVENIAQFSSDIPNTLVRSIVFFFVNAIIMFSISWPLAVTILPLIPLFWLIRNQYRGKLEAQAHRVQSKTGAVTGLLSEHLATITQAQLLSAEEERLRCVIDNWKELVAERYHQRRQEVSFLVAVSCVLTIAILAAIAGGVWQYKLGVLSIGSLVAFYTYTTRIFEPVSTAMDTYSRAQRLAASMDRIRAVLNESPSVPDHGILDSELLSEAFHIECEMVSFAYPTKAEVLRDVSLSIAKGRRIGLVGKSGSGKSTLSKLIVRLADPTSGTVKLGAQPLTSYSLRSVRNTICYLPQQAVLFTGTVRENLSFRNSSCSESEILAVLETVQWLPILDRLGKGLDTYLGPGANDLSGGERQRLAIARSLLRKPPVLILDESTSALDLPTETAVLRSIASCYRHTTLIFISHRLRSLTWMDQLILLEDGSINAHGTHQELYERSYLYRSLFEQQISMTDL
jgi:ABC-type multidrug transport system fused ATPase/permease subunit